jgi:hypothetical protein
MLSLWNNLYITDICGKNLIINPEDEDGVFDATSLLTTPLLSCVATPPPPAPNVKT